MYTLDLTSPLPPNGGITFTWRITGSAPEPGREISGVELSGCWTAPQVASVEARDAANAPLRARVRGGGHSAGRIEVEALSDRRLPATISVTFRSAFGTAGNGTNATVQAGKGAKATSSRTEVGGPTCLPAFRLELAAGTGGHTTASPSASSYAAGTSVTITATVDEGSELSGWTVDGARAGPVNPLVLNMTADHTVVATFAPTGAPPQLAAPRLDSSTPTSVFDATAFLYSGSGAVQVGVSPGIIDPGRVAVLRGKVLTPDGAPLPGARITVVDHPELGRTQSRADGMFDLAVNGGGCLTIQYAKSGLIPAQRHMTTPWQEFASLPDVVLVPYDSQVTAVDLASSAPIQVARGAQVTDGSGTRQATLLFPQGTTATMTMPDGSTQPLSSLDVRATELTVGARGPVSMPAELPPTSGYTYAAELSVDAAVAGGATNVRFDKPVAFYVENFLGFPVGTHVPLGYYDRAKAVWVPADDGRVIAIVGETSGKADVDVNGDGAADDAATLGQLGIDDAERERLAALYEPGQSLWRTRVTHFSPWDCNWPYRPPADASGPTGGPPRPVGGEDNDCPSIGSAISCLGQGLGETIGIAGTPLSLNYQSNRSPGRKAALAVPLSGEEVPPSLKRIELEVEVAGQRFTQSFAPATGASASFTWDGKDAYGRTVQGAQPVSVKVEYVYDAVYLTPAELAQTFGQSGTAFTPVPARNEVMIGDRWKGELGTLDGRASGLGGWTLNVHQAYDPVSGTLHDGTGTRTRATSVDSVIETFAGNGQDGSDGDGGLATEAKVIATGLVVGPDGSVFLAENSHRVRKVDPDGIITTVAGTGVSGFSGDGGPATQAALNFPSSLALGPDGSLYVGDIGNNRIRRIAAGGTITTFAGGGTQAGEGLPATDVQLKVPQGVAVGPDGSVYLSELFEGRIRKVSPDGLITTFAGDRGGADPGDGGPASRARLKEPRALALGPDGALYVWERGDFRTPPRVRRIGADGIITTYAGGGPSTDDGVFATDASIPSAELVGLAVGPGGLYIAGSLDDRVRRVRRDGLISTVAGTGEAGFAGDGGPAAAARINGPIGVAIAPNADIVFSDGLNSRVRRLKRTLPTLGLGDVLIASPDGQELFHFDELGHHVRTLHALTGAVEYTFSYDAGGRLSGITDVDGTVTSIERATDGKPTAIVAPGGVRTTLQVNGDGYLTRVVNPANEAVVLTYQSDGLLSSLTEPRGGVHRFTYDAFGGLATDEDPAGGVKTLTRTELDDGHRVVLRTPLGMASVYETHQRWFGSEHITTDPAGATTVNRVFTSAGKQEVTYPDGTTVETTQGPDPRFGMQAPRPRIMSVRTPGGVEQTLVATRAVTLTNPADPLSMQSLTDTAEVNGQRSTQSYDATTRTLTATSPAGRQSSLTYDARGRVVAKRPDLSADPVVLTYGPTGLLTQISRGNQRWIYAYDGRRRPISRTDAKGGITLYTYDEADRLLSTTSPNGQVYSVRYDPNGNRAAMTMPNGAEHAITYDSVNLRSGYQPPGNTPEGWAYDLDRRLTGRSKPTGRVETRTFDAGGRPATITSPEATVSLAYADSTDRPASTTRAPSGPSTGLRQEVTYSYDGSVPTAIEFRGLAAEGRYTYTSDDNLFLTAAELDSGGQSSTLDVGRDADGLITAMGPFTWARNGPGGAVSQISDGTIVLDQAYDGVAKFSDRRVSVAGTELYRSQPTFDSLGLITRSVETIGGTTHTTDYVYDANQQLIEVRRDATVVERYGYDPNANRSTRQVGANAAEVAAFDAQDRLVRRGSVAYEVNDDGFLVSRGNDTFAYGTRGELLSAHVGEQTVAYSYDALQRRVAKELSVPAGQSKVEYLYGDPGNAFRVTAVRSGSEVTVLFYDEPGSLYAFERAGSRYYVASDLVGTPRLVATSAGQVVRAIDYDAFGEVLFDSDPGFFLPIGFAGGLADPETGLVHLGYRDYEPASGRWTTRDPVLFDGGQFNLYAYVGNSPVTFRDPLGLWCLGGSGYYGMGGGGKVCHGKDGWSTCYEVGVGLGGGVELDPGGQGGAKDSLLIEEGVGCGPFAFGLAAEVNLCGGTTTTTGTCALGLIDPCADKLSHPFSKTFKCGETVKFAGQMCRLQDW